MHLHSAEPDAPGDFRVRQADPQHLYLRYLRDPQLQRNVHRSQNRIESYHQLRSAIAQVGGKKEITGKTDIEIEISNQCARLIANAIIGPEVGSDSETDSWAAGQPSPAASVVDDVRASCAVQVSIKLANSSRLR
jgi:hypothetical protein